MNLIRYIQGIRKGREINRLEREAMENPFLADALEGYDKIRGDHEVRIKRMQDKVSAQTRSSSPTFRYWTIAASILLIIGIGAGGYFLWNEFGQPKTIFAADVTLPDTTTVSENLEKSAIPDSIEAEYALKDNSDSQNKQMEVTKPANEQKIQDLSNMKKSVAADLKEDSSAKTSPTEEKTLKVDSVTTPQPVIGMKAYNEYLKTNLVRPTDEDCKNVTGLVTLSFFIDKNGRPYNIRIIKSLCPLSDWEAMRLVKEGPPWTISESIATVNIYF